MAVVLDEQHARGGGQAPDRFLPGRDAGRRRLRRRARQEEVKRRALPRLGLDNISPP
jgi:hypothetical protein